MQTEHMIEIYSDIDIAPRGLIGPACFEGLG